MPQVSRKELATIERVEVMVQLGVVLGTIATKDGSDEWDAMALERAYSNAAENLHDEGPAVLDFLRAVIAEVAPMEGEGE